LQSILLIEDRQNLRDLYAGFLRKIGYLVKEAGSAEEAAKVMTHHEFALVLTDYMLPGINGLTFLKQLKAQDQDFAVIVMTAFGEVKLAVEAMQHGAMDFLEKPIDLEHLKMVVARAIEHRKLVRRQQVVQSQNEADVLVAESDVLKDAIALSDRVAPSDVACLLLGESGVGKELFAKRIHRKSGRDENALVSINCAAIPAELIESELFGHEKGAFTGAVQKKLGLVEAADGGTLFLDEIGELPLALQPKLLRVIQTGEFRRVGGSKLLKCDIRLVCATNRDLTAGIRDGWFREDLYYRLAVFPIKIAPLRERKADIVPIAETLLGHLRYRHLPLPDALREQLRTYVWPGNVRELKNVLERALILAAGEPIRQEHLPEKQDDEGALAECRVSLDLQKGLKENLKDAEGAVTRRMIEVLLDRCDGHREKVAKKLGVSVKTLYNKIQAMGLDN